MRLEVDGETVFFSTGTAPPGDGDGAPSVVFVHGAGQDHTIWVMVARAFARHGYRVLAPDLPGHGLSGGDAHTTIEALSDWLMALLDGVGISSARLVGHSMGSLIAYDAAALLTPSLPMAVSEPLLAATADDDHAAIDMANTWSFSRPARLGGSPVPGVWMLGAGERLTERCGPGVYHADFAACDGYAVPETVPSQPTLILAGGADQMTPPRQAQALAATLPDSKLVMVEGCGHSLLAEAPNAVLDALRAHL